MRVRHASLVYRRLKIVFGFSVDERSVRFLAAAMAAVWNWPLSISCCKFSSVASTGAEEFEGRVICRKF